MTANVEFIGESYEWIYDKIQNVGCFRRIKDGKQTDWFVGDEANGTNEYLNGISTGVSNYNRKRLPNWVDAAAKHYEPHFS